ncbi:MAG: glycosyltransferase, partial [Pirellulaceae bacterium]|nr:glycosyltransferase [Pirellulaceae bacterium]
MAVDAKRVLYIHPASAQVDSKGVVRLESCALVDFLAYALEGDEFDTTILFPRARTAKDVPLPVSSDTSVRLLDLPLLPRSVRAMTREIVRIPRLIRPFLELRRMCRSTACLIVVGYSFIGTLAALLRNPSRERPIVFIIRGNRLRTAQHSNRPWLRKTLLVGRLRLYRLVLRCLLKRGRAEAWFQGEGNLRETAATMTEAGRSRLHLLNAVLDDRLLGDTRERNRETQKKGVVFVGRLVKEKGLLDLVKAIGFMRARGNRPTIQVIGTGPDEQLVRHVVSRAGLADQFEFVGMIPDRSEVLAKIAAAEALVLPSHTEGMPRVSVEAMSCGTTAILTAVGGIPLAFKDGVDALIVPPHRPDRLAHALETALCMPLNE